MRYKVHICSTLPPQDITAFLLPRTPYEKKQREEALRYTDSYSRCSRELKQCDYTPQQGNVFQFILNTCESVRRKYVPRSGK